MNYCDMLSAADLQLSVEYNGVAIRGHFVELMNHYYKVEMDAPYSALYTRIYNTCYPGLPQHRFIDENKISDVCYQSAQKKLIELYSIYTTVYAEADSIKKNLPAYDASLFEINKKIEMLETREIRQGASKTFREETFYQSELKKIDDEISELEIQKSPLFEKYFRIPLPVCMQEEVLEYVRAM